MNCEEFKQRLMSAPFEVDEALRSHQAECPECEAYSHEIHRFESKIVDSMQVQVPPGLAMDVIEVNQSHMSFKRIKKLSFALAATVMLVIGVSVFSTISPNPQLNQLILQHIEKEPFALTTLMSEEQSNVDATLASLGITVGNEFPKVRFLKRCYIGDELIAHFVVEGKQGPVTVLLMPHERVDTLIQMANEQLEGAIVPASQKGSIAVVGFMGEPVKDLAESLSAQVDFDL